MKTTTDTIDKSIASQFTVVGIDASDDGVVQRVTLEFIDTHNYWCIMVVREIFKAMQKGAPYVTLTVRAQ